MNNINVVVDVPNRFLDDILTTAFEGGNTYWLDSVTIKTKPDTPHKNLFNSDIISMGGALVLTSIDNDRGVLTKKRLLNAIEWYINKYQSKKHWYSESNTGLDVLEDYDAQDADTILQYALFGEVVYG